MTIGRREFITLLGGAVAWPLAARAQQRDRRRVGVFMNLAADDPLAQARLAAFQQGLQELGWVIGRNVTVDYRWGVGDADHNRRFASELVALAPDVILAVGASVDSLRQATNTVPIVFVGSIDPVGRGLVASRGATPPASPHLNSPSAGNCWSCSSKSRPR
jgi:putative ABC transport system substrate-binding protein